MRTSCSVVRVSMVGGHVSVRIINDAPLGSKSPVSIFALQVTKAKPAPGNKKNSTGNF